jgi:catechol 2,3-dioxygenase-like lactoylglutathione lyase family enzyme
MSTTVEMISQPLVEPRNSGSVVKPFVLSHGTLECYDLKATRRFFEEFLGLECVQHRKRSMVARCGLKFHIACVEVGERVHPVHMLNHWGVDVRTHEEVDAAHQAAIKLKDEYGIRDVRNPTGQHGVYSFYLVDLDHNWWEIQASASFRHDELFEGGERSERIARAAQLINSGNGK